jgi:hypothetical protein
MSEETKNDVDNLNEGIDNTNEAAKAKLMN